MKLNFKQSAKKARRENYPTATDALPLIDKINFDAEYEIVMLYVFGKTLICRNMEVATKFARQHGLDCITLDGDQVSRRNWFYSYKAYILIPTVSFFKI